MENNDFDKLLELWKKLYSTRIVENEHLMMPAFHVLTSCIVKPRLIYAGHYVPLKIHHFAIQQSGTGKSEVHKLVGKTVAFLGQEYRYNSLNTFSQAGIIGQVIEKKQGIEKRHGALYDSEFLRVDEARSLVSGNNWTDDLKVTLNGYLDDLHVAKKLGPGWLSYEGRAVIATGTFYFQNLKPSLIEDGFMQRFNMSYKRYTTDDILRISGKFDALSSLDYLEDVKPMLEEIKTIAQGIIGMQEKYAIQVGEQKQYVIKMNEETSKYFGEKVDSFFMEHIANLFKNSVLQNNINSFLIRGKVLGHKFMAQHAVLTGKDAVDNESADYAFPLVCDHLRSIANFLTDAFELDEYDIISDTTKTTKLKIAERNIAQWIIKNDKHTVGDFREFIQNNRNFLSIGELAALKLLGKMRIDGKIIDEKGEGSTIYLSVNMERDNKNYGNNENN